MSNIILVSLIQEHKERLPYLRNYSDDIFTYYEYDDMKAYHLWVETVKRYMQQYCKGDPAIKEFETLPELRIFLIDNYKRITDYKIYELKFNSKL